MATGEKEWRLRQFDQATERNHERMTPVKAEQPAHRGWTREDLYVRGGEAKDIPHRAPMREN